MRGALKWAVLCGGTGFALGFFGPLIVAPEANQGPLLGIFITGPGGAILGFLLGLLPIEEKTRRFLFVPLFLLGACTLVYFSGPKPEYQGLVVDGDVTACEDPAGLLPAAVDQWEKDAARVRVAARDGWKEDAPFILARDPGVVLTLMPRRITTLHKGRRFWNQGRRWSTPWTPYPHAQRAYARMWTACAAAPVGTQATFVVRDLQWGAWPPLHAPGFLRVELLETLSAADRALLPAP